jgi:hypothetical protein
MTINATGIRSARSRQTRQMENIFLMNYATWKNFFFPVASHTYCDMLADRYNQLRAPRKWQPISLKRLFAKTAKESLRARRGERMVQCAQEEEQMYMQVMAELDAVDNTPDDGEVEINDSEVYGE